MIDQCSVNSMFNPFKPAQSHLRERQIWLRRRTVSPFLEVLYWFWNDSLVWRVVLAEMILMLRSFEKSRHIEAVGPKYN